MSFYHIIFLRFQDVKTKTRQQFKKKKEVDHVIIESGLTMMERWLSLSMGYNSKEDDQK